MDDVTNAPNAPDQPALRIRFKEQGVTTEVYGSWVGDGLYRVETSVLTCALAGDLISFGDTIALGHGSGDLFEFTRVVSKGGWHTWNFLLTDEDLENNRLAGFLAKMEGRGGQVEQLFSGILMICLPPVDPYDPTSDLHATLDGQPNKTPE